MAVSRSMMPREQEGEMAVSRLILVTARRIRSSSSPLLMPEPLVMIP
jgi:hypothetical protein